MKKLGYEDVIMFGFIISALFLTLIYYFFNLKDLEFKTLLN